MRTIYQNTCLLSACLPPACSTNGPVQLSGDFIKHLSVSTISTIYTISIWLSQFSCANFVLHWRAVHNCEQFQWEKHDSNILDNKLLLQPVLKQTIKQTILHNTSQYSTILQSPACGLGKILFITKPAAWGRGYWMNQTWRIFSPVLSS